MTFDEWWLANGQRYYVSEPFPKNGLFVDMARDAFNAGQAQRAEVAPQFVKIGILHRRRTGDVDFLQEAEVIPLGLHETLDVYATSQCMNSKP